MDLRLRTIYRRMTIETIIGSAKRGIPGRQVQPTEVMVPDAPIVVTSFLLPEKTICLRFIPFCVLNGTQQRMKSCPLIICPKVTRRFGGCVITDTNGQHKSIPGLMAVAVLIVSRESLIKGIEYKKAPA